MQLLLFRLLLRSQTSVEIESDSVVRSEITSDSVVRSEITSDSVVRSEITSDSVVRREITCVVIITITNNSYKALFFNQS